MKDRTLNYAPQSYVKRKGFFGKHTFLLTVEHNLSVFHNQPVESIFGPKIQKEDKEGPKIIPTADERKDALGFNCYHGGRSLSSFLLDRHNDNNSQSEDLFFP